MQKGRWGVRDPSLLAREIGSCWHARIPHGNIGGGTAVPRDEAQRPSKDTARLG